MLDHELKKCSAEVIDCILTSLNEMFSEVFDLFYPIEKRS